MHLQHSRISTEAFGAGVNTGVDPSVLSPRIVRRRKDQDGVDSVARIVSIEHHSIDSAGRPSDLVAFALRLYRFDSP